MKLIEGCEAYYGRYWIRKQGDEIHIGIARKSDIKILIGLEAESLLERLDTASEWGMASAQGVLEDCFY